MTTRIPFGSKYRSVDMNNSAFQTHSLFYS